MTGGIRHDQARAPDQWSDLLVTLDEAFDALAGTGAASRDFNLTYTGDVPNTSEIIVWEGATQMVKLYTITVPNPGPFPDEVITDVHDKDDDSLIVIRVRDFFVGSGKSYRWDSRTVEAV